MNARIAGLEVLRAVGEVVVALVLLAGCFWWADGRHWFSGPHIWRFADQAGLHLADLLAIPVVLLAFEVGTRPLRRIVAGVAAAPHLG